MYRDNQLKSLLNSGGKALGCWTSMDNPITSEILAIAGFDFILIDHEHGYGDIKGLASQLQSISATNCTSILRVPNSDEAYVKKALDTGAECLMFPGVNTAREAENIVEMCRYSPRGRRGMAPGMIRATNYGMDPKNYVETAHDNTFIICQIETPEAVANIQEMGRVEGVDMFFIGPNDLSCSVNKFGQYNDPEIVDLIEQAENGIHAAGKFLGCIPYGDFDWQAMFDRGYNLTTAGTEVAMFREAALNIVHKHTANNRTEQAAE
ncbi:MAG: HpcH/HpaI aldolase family protein [Methyloligellaceae bacterium]